MHSVLQQLIIEEGRNDDMRQNVSGVCTAGCPETWREERECLIHGGQDEETAISERVMVKLGLEG